MISSPSEVCSSRLSTAKVACAFCNLHPHALKSKSFEENQDKVVSCDIGIDIVYFSGSGLSGKIHAKKKCAGKTLSKKFQSFECGYCLFVLVSLSYGLQEFLDINQLRGRTQIYSWIWMNN